VIEVGGALDEPSGSLEFHPEAEAELRAAARYYELRQAGLGDNFLREVERAAVVAVEHPEAGTPLGSGFRWVLMRRFPYAVVYRDVATHLEIIAVAHLRRRPGYWRTRT
jgi:toxin ParE1/3/4